MTLLGNEQGLDNVNRNKLWPIEVNKGVRKMLNFIA